MKWINLSLLIIWLCLLGLGMFWAWQSFNNMQTISGGGYLYDDVGEIIGFWDGWDKADYPHWMFALALPIMLLTDMPFWWMIMFWSITIYLCFLFWAYRPCIYP